MSINMPSLPPCRHRALFLDFDGTLVDIAPTPASVEVPAGLGATLLALKDKLNGAVAIITGRRISDIDDLIGQVDVPIAGVHGSEVRLGAGGPISFAARQVNADAYAALNSTAALLPGAWIEDKETALSVHYRDVAPAAVAMLEAALTRALAPWSDRLAIRPGRKVFEVVSRDVSKGAALEAFMRLPRFAGRIPVMVGDDHADDVAMQAATRLGGAGLGVAGEYFPPQAAIFRNPAEVRTWLNQQIDEGD